MFLFKTDYFNLISEADYNEVFNYDESQRLRTEKSVQEFISMYIRHRYDVTSVFKAWSEFSLTTTFAVGDYFQYTADTFSATTAYVIDDRVVYEDNIYKCTIASTGAFDTDNWTLVCENNLIFTCIAASTGKYPEDTDYFTQSDPRNQQIITVMIDIVLYNIHSLIVPNNIPTIRRVRYNSDSNVKSKDGSAIGTLIGIQHGDIQIDLPIYADTTKGQIISYGSNMKRNSSY